MSIDFKICEHRYYLGVKIVEILIDGDVAGVIYPAGEKGIKLVSAHIEKVVEDDGSSSWPPIPDIQVKFNPAPYKIVGRKLIKL